MSYVVLARKYRPKTFAELVGQKHIVRILGNAMAMERVHHAFVFTGARGVGKTSTARLLARALNCQQGPTLSPCGSCQSCNDIARGSAQDVLEIDGASHTGVDHVRALRETVRYLPAAGRFKLYIIDEVHMLSTAAFNALLKTLEEPPPHVKFILATTEPHKIPATILSRTQRLDFQRVAADELVAHLQAVLAQEQLHMAAQILTLIARQSQGSVRDALSLLDQAISYAGEDSDAAMIAQALGVIDHQLIVALTDAIAARQADAALAHIQRAEQRGYDLAELGLQLAEHVHDIALVHVLEQPQERLPHVTHDELAVLQRQAQARSASDWQRLFAAISSLAGDVGRSPTPRMTLEMGVLRLMLLAPTQELTQLLGRLDDLLAHAPAPTATSTPPALGPRDATAPPSPAGGTDGILAAQAQAPESAAAPCSPAGPAAAATTAARPHTHTAEGWRSLVDAVRRARPALASVLERGHLLSFTPEAVQVAFERKTFWWDAANDPDNRNLIRSLLREQLGAEVALQIVAAQGQGPSQETLADERERKSREGWQAIEAEALAHEGVRAATSILGGEVQRIEPAAGDAAGDGPEHGRHGA